MVNYFTDFIQDVPTLMEPLRELTRGRVKFNWGLDQEMAFETMKKALVEATALQIFDPDAETFLTMDASDVGIGGHCHRGGPRKSP